ncbi:MAG: methylated-DNA--[protein]-cysteine S-methyltransferase [Candidatus Woesearchaeota archaeon]
MQFFDLAYQKKHLTQISNFKSIRAALQLAEQAHAMQKRDNGTPYILHPIRAANYLYYNLIIQDPDLISAALLHDIIEDTNIGLKTLEHKFGRKVSALVKTLTRRPNQTKLQKFKETLKQPKKIRLLKAVDWLDNLTETKLVRKRDKKYFRILKEAETLYFPLAKSVSSQIAKDTVSVILSGSRRFSHRVYAACLKVPAGKITTYKAIAQKLNTKAYRAIGQALRHNPFAPIVPCHRVVSSSGKIGGFQGKTKGKPVKQKINILKKEGIAFSHTKIANFEQAHYPF